jgi:two-component system chemotaxis response regulator CheB
MSNAESQEQNLRVLVVDDSAYNRQTITTMLEDISGVQVVGRAMDGKVALQKAFELEPDLITLDLEMPEMDGFAFLRLLMAKRPTPVLIISGYAARDNVFRALDLGALDFIAKPGLKIGPSILEIEAELRRKIAMVRRLQSVRLKRRADSVASQRRVTQSLTSVSTKPQKEGPLDGQPARRVVCIASSTGGPPTVQQLLRSLPANLDAAVVIAQHMPARFTTAFAQRLNRVVDLRVLEAMPDQPFVESVVYVIPGGYNFSLKARGERFLVGLERVETPPGGGVVLAPSADHLFTDIAEHFGRRACGVVLTGMGNDGSAGAHALHVAGGKLFAENPKTAVMPGMPQSLVETGLAAEVAPVERLHLPVLEYLKALARADS